MARVLKHKVAKTSIAIVGDGHTERIYFADMRDTDRPDNLTISPDFPKKVGSYSGVLEKAIELKEKEYDHVYALIDMDKVFQDNKQVQYAKDKATAQAKGIVVLENNPCFEVWILLHFVRTSRLFQNCGEVVDEIKKAGRIPAYDKSKKFQEAAKLYANYKENRLKANAIPNARFLEEQRRGKSPLYPRAQTFRFFEWYFNLEPYELKEE